MEVAIVGVLYVICVLGDGIDLTVIGELIEVSVKLISHVHF